MVERALAELEQLLQGANLKADAKASLINTLAQLQNISTAARWSSFGPCPDATASRANSSRPCPGGSSSSRGWGGQAAAPGNVQHSPVMSCRPAELQLLRLLADSSPADVSALLVHDHNWLRTFLTSTPDKVRAWFGHFGPTGINQFKYGAKALANYALAERADAWRHLAWKGKHSQSPVAVAAKPHYFGELDVPATVYNLLQSCPSFWRSEELQRSCQGGQWLSLDLDAVCQELSRLIRANCSSRQQPLVQLLRDYIATADWSSLCHQLLPLLPDTGLLQVASILAADLQDQQQLPQPKQHQQHQYQPDSMQQQQQQQQQQPWQRRSLLHSWCSLQGRFCEQHLVSTAEARIQLQAAEPVAAATPAAQLPCVRHPELLLLGCLQHLQLGKDSLSCWSFKELLLAGMLTCQRAQLLSTLRQDDDAGSHLIALVSAAAVFGAPATGSTTAAAATVAGCSTEGGSQIPAPAAPAASAGTAAACGPFSLHQASLLRLLSSLQHKPQPLRLLLPLVACWLLRLHHLLLLSAAAEAATQQQQERGSCEVLLPTGGRCCLLFAAPTGRAAGTVTQPHAAKQGHLAAKQPSGDGRENSQHEQEHEQQQEAEQLPGQKQPLRRGSAVKVKNAQSRQELRSSLGGKRRKRSSKRHRRDASSSSSSSSSRGSGSDGSGTSSSDGGRRRRSSKRKRRARHRQRQRSGSSSSSSDAAGGSDDDWAGLDLDADGQLLDPADFSSRRSSRARHGRAQQGLEGHQYQQGAGAAAASGPAEPASEASGQRQLLEVQCVRDLNRVLDQLASLSVGGRFWQWPQCCAALPVSAQRGSVAPMQAAGQQEGAADSGCVLVVSGTVTEVADAAAQLWLWGCLQQMLQG